MEMDAVVNPDQSPHLPVLYNPIIQGLQPHSTGQYVDATVGAGGHALGILQESSPNGQLLGLDLDPQALQLARQRLAPYQGRCHLIQASYVTLPQQLAGLGWTEVDGIIADLGVSSMQLDTASRGFSFLADGPLDMRFSPEQSLTAADLVNTLPEQELAEILWRYGEERNARAIARMICATRPYATTRQLAEGIKARFPAHGQAIHPATRTFQGLRIAVNRELNSIEEFLPLAIKALKPGGRLGVISFHSLEDRIVKQFFRLESKDCICPPEQPVCTCGHKASIRELSRKPVLPDEEEISRNPRARSAKLRFVERLK